MEFSGRPSLAAPGHKLLQSDAESRARRLNVFRARGNVFAISLRYFDHGGGRSGKFYEGAWREGREGGERTEEKRL